MKDKLKALNLLKAKDVPIFWTTDLWMLLLIGVSICSFWLAMKVSLIYTQKIHQLILVGLCIGGVIGINVYSWVVFWVGDARIRDGE